VDTESFCAGRNLKRFTRQSAQAGDAEQSNANAMVAIVARIEVVPLRAHMVAEKFNDCTGRRP
jgi:hypothetical protein